MFYTYSGGEKMDAHARILVIDDDAIIGRSFDRVLTKQGYEVNSVLSGEDGLKSLEDNDYDMVFTDIKMPGMDGLTVAEKIKNKCPWTPVVVITGFGTEENEAKASVLGLDGFVQKPLTPEMIESIALKTLEKTNDVSEEVAEDAYHGWIRGLKNVGLFFASPFIALGYIIALPLVGFAMFAKLGYESLAKR